MNLYQCRKRRLNKMEKIELTKEELHLLKIVIVNEINIRKHENIKHGTNCWDKEIEKLKEIKTKLDK